MRRDDGRPGPSITPSQAADLAAAKRAQARVRAVGDVGASRWPRVREVAHGLSEIRRENHIAEDLSVLFRERW